MKSQTLTLTILACVLAIAPFAAAQGPTRGMENEFGRISAPYSVDMDGQRVPIEITVVIENAYHEKDGRFYMFILDAGETQLDVSLDQVIRSDTGQELTCYQRVPDPKEFKCSVDGRGMPPQGTPITLVGTVGASKAGTFTLGAIALPFTATWGKIQMSNGFDAELYAGTQVNVINPTSGSSGLSGVGNKLPIPGVGMLGVTVAAVVAVGLVATRRK